MQLYTKPVTGRQGFIVGRTVQVGEHSKIRGTVRAVSLPTALVGNRTTCVQAGDADFCLALQDIGGLRPEAGTTVEFVVHDLSMWDEAL